MADRGDQVHVIPLDDRTAERANADLAGRPQLIKGDTQVFYPGMTHLSENSVLSIKNKSFSVTAEVIVPDVPGAPLDGTIIAQGGAIGGWSFYVREGRTKFLYNLLGIQLFTTEASRPLPAGKHQVRAEFAYDGGGFGKGGTVTLYTDGEKVGEGRVDANELIGVPVPCQLAPVHAQPPATCPSRVPAEAKGGPPLGRGLVVDRAPAASIAGDPRAAAGEHDDQAGRLQAARARPHGQDR
jgi:hypothetical protein